MRLELRLDGNAGRTRREAGPAFCLVRLAEDAGFEPARA